MKKSLWLVLLLALVCILTLSACTESYSDEDDDDEDNIEQTADDKSQESTTDNIIETPFETTNGIPTETVADTKAPETNTSHIHMFEEWITVKKSTCTEDGINERYCYCGEKQTQTLPANGHTEVIDPAIAATCTADGKTEGKHCDVCGEIFVSQIKILAAGHNYDSVVIEPTATQNGSAQYTCSACDDFYLEEIVPTNFIIVAENKKLVGYTGENSESLVIPSVFESEGCWYKVIAIDDSAFIDSYQLISVEIPETVTRIGQAAFANCKRLTSINIPYGVTIIETATFACCDNLINIDIPNSIISIDRSAFGICFNMTSITIPASVTTLDVSAFEGCEALTTIAFEGTMEQWGAIEKTSEWNNMGNVVIKCVDGEIHI